MNKVSKIFVAFGFIEILSGMIIHPSIAIFWRSLPTINFYNPMKSYSYLAITIGIITILIGTTVLKKEKNILVNISTLFLVLSLIFLSDRLLLAKYGTGLWEYDKVLHFKHRPNSTFTWGNEFGSKLIKINNEGFHDNEFSYTKSKNEIRIFILGNSITMGHGVTREETFATQLENLVEYKNNRINAFNLGVQGYSTEQELVVLKRELKYKPDLILLEFCLNDITEPITVNKKFGGSGFDYHMIFQTRNELIGYFTNETGFGRFVYRLKYLNDLKNGREVEIDQITKLSKNPFFNNQVKKSWEITFSSIKEIKTLSNKINVPFIVLIFPYTFQLGYKEFQKPQRVIKSFLISQQIKFIDFTEVFEKRMYLNDLKKYFLDEDHYTNLGHLVIAREIQKFLQKINLL